MSSEHLSCTYTEAIHTNRCNILQDIIKKLFGFFVFLFGPNRDHRIVTWFGAIPMKARSCGGLLAQCWPNVEPMLRACGHEWPPTVSLEQRDAKLTFYLNCAPILINDKRPGMGS